MKFSFKKVLACELAPNFQSDDVWAACKSMIMGDNTSENKVISWFQSYLPTLGPLRFTDSGRTALTLLLESLQLPQDSEVLIQAFSCVVVPNSLLQANLKPVLCDINEDTYNFDLNDVANKITQNTKVWIIQHTFGITQDIRAIQALCKKHNIILIEDCAHALGTHFSNGQKAGSMGDAAIFSFGRDKVISTTVGGAGAIAKTSQVLSQQQLKQWDEVFAQKYVSLPKQNAKQVFQALMYPILTVAIIKPLYSLNIGKLILLLSQKWHIIAGVYTTAEAHGTAQKSKQAQYADRLFPLLSNQLNKFEIFHNHRSLISHIYASELSLPILEHVQYLRFPINLYLTNQQAYYQKIKNIFQYNSILIGTWYNFLFLPKQANLSLFGYKGTDSLPISEKLANNCIINLPTNINTTPQDAQRIITILKHTTYEN